jgi:HAD superfamily hydrolase (TIGR01509 family)
MAHTVSTDPKLGVLFDYNGVIVKDEILHEQAFVHALYEHQITFTPEMYTTYCLGRSDLEGVRNLKVQFSRALKDISADQLVKCKQLIYRDMLAGKDILFPRAAETISRLALTCRVGVVTSSTKAEVMPLLTKAKIASLFTCVIAVDDFGQGKPAPDPYLHGIKAMGLKPQSIVAVEDSPSGVLSAKAAGLKCIAVETTTVKDKLVGADLIVNGVWSIDIEMIRLLLGRGCV